MPEEDEDQETPVKTKGITFSKILLFFVLPVFIVGVTVGGLYFAGVFDGEEVQLAEEDSEGESEGEGVEVEEDIPVGPAVYVPIDPAFVVNFIDGGKARFLQITMEIMTRNVDVPQYIATHMPAIRNNLVMLFSSQTYENISTLEGKEGLREEALSVVQDILEQETGDAGIEAVYFTSLVMQ